MKGPFERLKYDLRRVWECPLCKNHERTDGSVTHFVCRCRAKEEPGAVTVMKLVSDGPRRVDGKKVSNVAIADHTTMIN